MRFLNIMKQKCMCVHAFVRVHTHVYMFTFKYLAAIESLPMSQKRFTARFKHDIASVFKERKLNFSSLLTNSSEEELR